MKMILLLILSVIIVLVLTFFISLKADLKNKSILYAMHQIRLVDVNYKTMVISASAEIKSSPQQAWLCIIKANEWKQWQYPLVQSVRMHQTNIGFAGASFEQLLKPGFPLGDIVSRERVAEAEPGKLLSWWKDENGIRSCHVWMIDSLGTNRIKIYNTEVFHGNGIALIKLFDFKRWNNLFQQSVNALKNELERCNE